MCEYKTEIKGNYTLHLDTKKHKQNVKQEEEKKHLKQSSKERLMAEKLTLMQQLLAQKDETMQRLLDEKDKALEMSEKTINIMAKEKKSLLRQNNQILQDHQTLQQKSDEHIRLLSNMMTRLQKPTPNKTFAMIENYSMAKIFAPIEDLSGLKKGYKTGDDFAYNMIIMYKNDELIEYVSEFILNYYKHIDPRYQSIFNFDAARHNYKIIEKSRRKLIISEWNDDLKGDKTKKLAIKPVLKYISDHVKRRFTTEKYKRDLEKDTEYIMELYSHSAKFLTNASNGIISTSILYYLSSRLGITYDQQLMITEHNENQIEPLLLN